MDTLCALIDVHRMNLSPWLTIGPTSDVGLSVPLLREEVKSTTTLQNVV
jgi:hypothetical protein